MCGIAGYIVNRDSEQLRTVAGILALVMEDRGSHSWGMMYGSPGDSPSVHKVANSVSNTFALPEEMPRAMAIHTRYATTGTVKAGNAHPFTATGSAGEVIGMHNGIISNHKQLGRAFKRKYRVDSEHIFAHIADGLALSDLEGYGTVVYSHNGEWLLGTFNGGELAVVLTELGIFFASTEHALRLALRVAGIEITKWLSTKDTILYAATPKGLTKKGSSLTVANDVWCGKWEDGPGDDVKLLDPGMEIDLTLDEGDIVFDSEGQECENCGTRIQVGAEVWFTTANIMVCGKCHGKSGKKKGGKK